MEYNRSSELRKMSPNLEYKGTVRMISDRMEADIYKIKGSKNYMIFYSEISMAGKKRFINKKMMESDKEGEFTTLKNKIREKMVLEAYN